MGVQICGVLPHSPAARFGLRPGDELLAINGHPIADVLDYRFYMTDELLSLELMSGANKVLVPVRKEEYEDLGLEFDTYLMDKQRSCRNRCIFCFVDQMPAGQRDSLYFKDDDSRMSFLFGNYITLTNLQEQDVERICKMHISPVNVSVHSTNPRLRVEMMGNPRAGEVLEYLSRLARAGIRINAQLVLCPGINDGMELERTLGDLSKLLPALQSVAAVPVGLTRHREGLTPLRLFTPPEAGRAVDTLEQWGERMRERHGAPVFFASDELYLLAGRELPGYGHYGEFHQLENGVGMLRLLQHEFDMALEGEDSRAVKRRVTLATGVSAAPFLERLAGKAMERFPGLAVQVTAIRNRFFGESITVAGLVTGGDLLEQLGNGDLGDELLLPAAMLRREGDLFLDGMPLPHLSAGLERPVRVVEADGFSLLDALLGIPPGQPAVP